MHEKPMLGDSDDFRKAMALAKTCTRCHLATAALYLLREQLLIEKDLVLAANFVVEVRSLTLNCPACGVGKGATMKEGSPLT